MEKVILKQIADRVETLANDYNIVSAHIGHMDTWTINETEEFDALLRTHTEEDLANLAEAEKAQERLILSAFGGKKSPVHRVWMPARLPVQLKLMTIKQSGPWLKTVAAWAVGGMAQEGAGRRRETGGVAQLKGDGAAGSREPMEESTIAGAHLLTAWKVIFC